jgi:hypothetical protein
MRDEPMIHMRLSVLAEEMHVLALMTMQFTGYMIDKGKTTWRMAAELLA